MAFPDFDMSNYTVHSAPVLSLNAHCTQIHSHTPAVMSELTTLVFKCLFIVTASLQNVVDSFPFSALAPYTSKGKKQIIVLFLRGKSVSISLRTL